MYYVYILVGAERNKSYVGMTSKDPIERLKEHNQGSNDWTRRNGPFILKYYESFICKKDALRRELFLKSGVGNKLKSIIVKYF